MSHTFPLSRQTLIAITFALFFLLPQSAFAETIHCGCEPSADAAGTSMTLSAGQKICYDIDSSKLANPTDCSTLPTNAGLGTTIVCDKAPLSATQAQPVSKGICAQGPQPALATEGDAVTKPSQNPAVAPMAIPTLNTNIPGFAPPKDFGSLLGSYVNALYRYGLSISVVIATVMFIWGAFIYLLGSGNIGSIQKGKDIMKDAIIGMLLLLSANLILRTINPSTITFQSLNPSEIKPEVIPSTGVLAETYTPPGSTTPVTSDVPILGKSKGNKCLLEAFGSTNAAITAQLTTVTFLKDKYQVHKLAVADFQAAFAEIEQASESSPVGQWVKHMMNMPPKTLMCTKVSGYPERGSRTGGGHNPKLDAAFAAATPEKQPCLSCNMHWLALALDLDPCFNTMCKDGDTCVLAGKNAENNPVTAGATNMPPELVAIFARHNIYWGGFGWQAAGTNWTTPISRRDAMHFEWHGLCWQ